MKRAVLVVPALALLAAGGGAATRTLEYRGAAKPGVHVVGLDVAGKSTREIVSLLHAWSRQPVTIRARGRSFRVPRGWVISIDATATARRALAAGSALSLVVPQRVDVRPVVGRTEGTDGVLRDVARAERAPVSATVAVQGRHVVTTPAVDGLRLDRTALLRRLATAATVLDAPFVVEHPAIREPAARSAASTARLLIARPVVVDYHGARLGALTTQQLAHALRIVAGAHRFSVRFDGAALARVTRPRLARWIRRARNAQFAVSGDAAHVVPSRPGRDVVPAQIAAAVTHAAHTDDVARIELGERDAAVTTADAQALGIRRKLVSYTTQMGESSPNRIHNVHLMADLVDGTVIRPGQTFSFNGVVGPRTAERGFVEGQEIIGSLVLPSIGGGVCQTATTLFNDAFELGLPILERTNHNLYLSHYPLGRDATVSWGGPDLRFRNDMKTGILIKTSYTDATLTFTFYGTPDGRRVVSHTGPQVDWTQPSMNYAVDPSAPPGSVKVVPGSGEQGFDVTVTRDVFDSAGNLLRHDAFRSHYIPDSPTTVYGPGRTPPGPYIVLPAST